MAVVDMAMQTSHRVSEMARHVVGDFDPRRQALKVWRHKYRKRQQETVAISKALSVHLKSFIQWKGAVGQGTDKDDPLFVGKREPLSARGLQQIFKAGLKRAGLPPELSIHCCRHTMAVHVLRKTENLRMVQKQMGHRNPATTANMYADVTFEDMRDGLVGPHNSTGHTGR